MTLSLKVDKVKMVMIKTGFCLGLVPAILVLAITGCNTTTATKTEPVIAVPESQIVSSPKPSMYEALEAKLLFQAEQAFRQKRYLPIAAKDNAYDRFHSVLMLNSDNSTAKAGLQAIMLSYSDRIRRLMEADRLDSAQNILTQVETYYPANGLLLELKKGIDEQRRAQAKQLVIASESSIEEPKQQRYEEIKLNPKDLSSKNDSAVELLNAIALRLQTTDESVMIYARNDAEGRWIYKQMKSAVKGYRVRGDIRYSKSPKIRILPPI